MITNITFKTHCKPLVQIQELQGVFTACTRRAHNAPTALHKTQQRCHNVPTARLLTLCASAVSMFKTNAAA